MVNQEKSPTDSITFKCRYAVVAVLISRQCFMNLCNETNDISGAPKGEALELKPYQTKSGINNTQGHYHDISKNILVRYWYLVISKSKFISEASKISKIIPKKEHPHFC